jgi:aryl-alcohol dehydrogenase-like predicted oxidoreductase
VHQDEDHQVTIAKRTLGRSSLEVTPLMLGGNVFGWTADEATSFELLDAFVANGFDFIDTANMYSSWVPGHQGGESEAVIGKWMKLRGNRSKVIVATKVGMEMPGRGKGLSKATIVREAEDSLRRLQTDYIDLYQSHQDDPDTPVEETLEAYAQLKQQGKVRVIGASNFGAPRLAASLAASVQHGWPRYESLQPEYNLLERAHYERELEPLCLKEGLGVVTYFSLAKGFLSGKYRSEADMSKSPRGAWIKPYLGARGMRILAAVDAAAERFGSSPTAVALAWLLARPSVTAPIASATSLAQLQQLMDGARLKLDQAALESLNAASAPD